MQSLLGDLQSMGQGDCLTKAEALALLSRTIPGAIQQSSDVAVRVLLASYSLTFSDQEWLSLSGRFTQAAPGRTIDPSWGHNSNAQQFSKPVSSGGFSVPT